MKTNLTKSRPSFAFFIAFAFATSAFANELIAPREQLLKDGFRETTRALKIQRLDPTPAKGLNWPVSFEDAAHSMGNVMTQYQEYGDGHPYFHGGCDLRAKDGSWVTAPVSGKFDAGHYSYDTNDDGSLTKFMKPWPETGQALYFEVSITTDDGIRYEFHHVDRNSIPADLVQGLNRGNARVTAGQHIGKVATWPQQGADGSYYHHIHYNIILPSGIRVNPESVSPLVSDHVAPNVAGVYGVNDNDRGALLSQGSALTFHPKELVVTGFDKNDTNVYAHTPPSTELIYDSGERVSWDFREKLSTATGTFPNIQDVFVQSLRLLSGDTLETQGNYDENFFLLRLKVPASAKGAFTVRVTDASGNQTTVSGSHL